MQNGKWPLLPLLKLFSSALFSVGVLTICNYLYFKLSVYCNPGYKTHEGTCYRFHTDKQTWDGALFQSAKDNATLVSFHASHEEAFVQTLVPPGNTGLIWTGLNDRITEGTYTWSDGTSVEYTTWKANEPTGKKEDCVGVEVISYGTMSDVPCTEPHYYVSRQPLEGNDFASLDKITISALWRYNQLLKVWPEEDRQTKFKKRYAMSSEKKEHMF